MRDMCNICFLPNGIEVPSEEIHNAGTWNTDGYGWAIAVETGVILTGRSMNLDEALATFEVTRKFHMDAPALFHSRFATHGSVSLANVHPFPVGKYAVVAHNGILPTKFQPQKGSTDDRSDTAILAQNYMPGWASMAGHWSRKNRRRIGRIIGTGNKLAILSVSPHLPRPMGYLVNGDSGEWDWRTGAWFSNHDYYAAWSAKTSGPWSGWTTERKHSGGVVVGGKPENPAEECPMCFALDVDPLTNICRVCRSCLDCREFIADCLCYVPNKKASMSSELVVIRDEYRM